MKKLNTALAVAAAFGALPDIRAPQSDWQHSDERLKKAEEKRKRKQAKRLEKLK